MIDRIKFTDVSILFVISVPALNPNLPMPAMSPPMMPGMGGLPAPSPMPNLNVPMPGGTVPMPTGLETSPAAAGGIAAPVAMETPAAAPEPAQAAAPEFRCFQMFWRWIKNI